MPIAIRVSATEVRFMLAGEGLGVDVDARMGGVGRWSRGGGLSAPRERAAERGLRQAAWGGRHRVQAALRSI